MLREIGFHPLDPWTLTDVEAALSAPEGVERKQKWKELNPVIGANNAEAILRSKIVVAILDGTDVDSGTASEIGYAAAFNKPIIGYRGDFRLSADNEGSIVNLQVEYFIHLRGGTIVTTLDDLRRTLIGWHKKLQS